jgi:GTP cyclohydrolase IA
MNKRVDQKFNKHLQSMHPSRQDALEAVRTLISYIGEDPDRPGLLKTPERVIRAWEQDLAIGYNKKYIRKQTESILGGQFEDGAEEVSEMIVVRDIPFHSCCEHHMLIFSGLVSIGYIANGKILGLSKLVRIVDLFSKRLQVQERLTNQIANFIEEKCKPIGVGVIIVGKHSCMEARGVRRIAPAITSALRGEMLDKPEVREEFLKLVDKK